MRREEGREALSDARQLQQVTAMVGMEGMEGRASARELWATVAARARAATSTLHTGVQQTRAHLHVRVQRTAARLFARGSSVRGDAGQLRDLPRVAQRSFSMSPPPLVYSSWYCVGGEGY